MVLTATLGGRQCASPSAAAAAASSGSTPSHDEVRDAVKAFVEAEINPHVDAWEKDGIFPAHDLFKKMGDAGILGLNKPTQFGGMGLDFTYALAAAEALGESRCGGVPMAIGVQTDMATPALARFGSDEVGVGLVLFLFPARFLLTALIVSSRCDPETNLQSPHGRYAKTSSASL